MQAPIKDSRLDVVVVGAGHAGLSVSYYLKKYGLDHLVFERGEIGETWRSQRWDSFVLNTANRINVLPGETYSGEDPAGFSTASQFIQGLKEYVSTYQLPVVEHANVLSIEKIAKDSFFTITVSENGNRKIFYCNQVIVCSGSQNEKKIPAWAKNLPADLVHFHVAEYKNASQLPDGPVLVTGSAQSGCQVAEELIEMGKEVYISTSAVPRIPRHYRGGDIMDWLLRLNFFDVPTSAIKDPKVFQIKAPQLTGTGQRGHTLSLQSLARRGVVLLGKMEHADINQLYFQPNAIQHIKFADEFSMKVKEMINEYIAKNNISSPSAEMDEADVPDQNLYRRPSIASLSLDKKDVNSIIWTTGFGCNYEYIKLPVLDADGQPLHQNGVSPVEGLYFLGVPWLRKRKSGLICGIREDAEFIGEQVLNYAGLMVKSRSPI